MLLYLDRSLAPVVNTSKADRVPFICIRKSSLAPGCFSFDRLRTAGNLWEWFHLCTFQSSQVWFSKDNSGSCRQNRAVTAVPWQLEAWNIMHAFMNVKDIKWGMFLIYILKRRFHNVFIRHCRSNPNRRFFFLIWRRITKQPTINRSCDKELDK